MDNYATSIDRIYEKYQKFRTEKQAWYSIYDLISEYVMHNSGMFSTSSPQPIEILNKNVMDDTAVNANHLMASTLIGALWPNGARTFQITAPSGAAFAESDQVKLYYEYVTKQMVEFMDNPKAGLITSLEEYMLDQGAYATSGLGVFENDDSEVPIIYKAFGTSSIYIDENTYGLVDTVYIEKFMTIKNMVEEYGLSRLTAEQQKGFVERTNHTTKVKIIIAIEPRQNANPEASANDLMPYESCHVDIENKNKLRLSGFKELPVFVTRFWKRSGLKYGFSPAMNALPSILELNALREAVISVPEKQVAPPLAVWDAGILGPRGIDTSADAVNVFTVSGRQSSYSGKLVEPLYTVGDMQPMYARLTELTELIKNHFFQDRLLDLNNEVRMTLGEANIRNELRGQSLGTIYARQVQELFRPLVERTFNILLAKGLLGVVQGSEEEQILLMDGLEPVYIPEEIVHAMATGKEVYKILFVSPAVRIMQSEELAGIKETVMTVSQLAAVNPEILDTIDFDFMARRISEISGAPRQLVRSDESVAKIREQRAQQQQAAAQAQMMQMSAETAKHAATANKMMEGG